MVGIILSGGRATRLFPISMVVCKQLLPVYDKPMIYYPLNTLLKAGIKDILIIISPESAGHFINLLGDGSQFGARISYKVQHSPEGLAQAFTIGRDFIGGENVCMILGDNIFEDDFSDKIRNFKSGAMVFAKKVPDPERFGIVEMDSSGKALSIEEKPKFPKSDLCVTGLYVYDGRASDIASSLKKSDRGEYEITDMHRWYMERGELDVSMVSGEWLDAGTFDSLLEAQILAKERLSKNMIIK
jgi:glucose-1-phosphate thymidylyltransferase